MYTSYITHTKLSSKLYEQFKLIINFYSRISLFLLFKIYLLHFIHITFSHLFYQSNIYHLYIHKSYSKSYNISNDVNYLTIHNIPTDFSPELILILNVSQSPSIYKFIKINTIVSSKKKDDIN